MNKRKQKQLRRILAAKCAEKCGQFEVEKLKADVWALSIHLQQTNRSLKIQNESRESINRYFVSAIKQLEDDIKRERISHVLLGLASGMIGGIIGMFIWVLCIL
ncbi:hypothetical protein BBB48_06860 [Haemophilus parainfluenzae]|uniref:Uncharacterized protein n=1 Tax=Haemophilus parainfluenzae TaxID=729 RepID=A0AB36E8Q9_HAEPA|nr:hypothetical protein [Haemophilus parainfluenzae]OBY51117.1 hypothetical protein BBB48_06860 [Haemophilus parainfluenzae]